jgi:hypothetical protein
MTESAEPSAPSIQEEDYEVPKRALDTYARLWQFETWLRRMVYVELKALLGDGWSQDLKKSESFDADKRLTHMPTPEMNTLSYSQLSGLKDLMGKHWKCFERYLPPQDLWDAKLKEIMQIRHRIAHFRRGHIDDHARLLQFLRDIDRGFWTFCTSYNHGRPMLPQKTDRVTEHFLPLDPLPWGEIRDKEWARVGFVDKTLVIGMTVEVLRRPWAAWESVVEGNPGFLYDFTLTAHDERTFDYPRLLKGTESLHSHVVHVCLSSFENSARLTLPALLGSAKIIEVMERVLDVARYTVGRSRNPIAPQPDELANEWPEHILGPKNPLTFLDPDMKCSFFNV